MDLSFITPGALVLAVAVFVALLLLMEGLYLLWHARYGAEARRLDERIRALASEKERAQAAVLRQGLLGESLLIERWTRNVPGRRRLEQLLLQADLRWSVGRLLTLSLLSGLVAALLADVLARQAFTMVLAAGCAAGAWPWLYLLRRRQRRIALLQAQLPDALDLMARALRAGHAFSSSLQMVGEEMPDPIAAEFRLVHDEVNFGMSLQKAFANLTERVPLNDLRYFIVAVLIQREAGGNLTELLGSLAGLIRARLRLLARVRVLSSEGRLSAWVLVLLPFALAGLLAVFNPEFIRPLWTDPIGLTLLNWMVGMMVVGLLMIRRIIRIRV